MKLIKLFVISIFVFILNLLLVPTAESTLVLSDIDLGGGSTADIHVESFESNSAFCNGLNQDSLNLHTIFAVHGLSGSAGAWQNLSNALFANNPTGGVVCKVLAIEMPGHGGSGLPTPILFGELSHINYANAILNSLTELAQQGIRPISIISHSNGALNIQVAQQLLVNLGTNFAQEYGIEKITFLAGIPSAPISWPLADTTGDALEALAACYSGFDVVVPPLTPECQVFDDDTDGDVDWNDIQAIDMSGIIFDCDPLTVPVGISEAPNTPPGNGSCEDPTTLGDRLPGVGFFEPEPLNIIRAVFDALPQMRPATNPGIFGGLGATLQVIAFEMDTTVGPPSVHQNLFNHLINGTNGVFFLVEGPDTNHGFFDIDPEGFLEAITGHICLLPLQKIEKIATPIPTLSEWGLIAMAGVLGIVGFIVIRRRKVTA